MRHHEKMSKPHKTLVDQVEIAENNIDLDLLLSELVIDYENNKKIKYYLENEIVVDSELSDEFIK